MTPFGRVTFAWQSALRIQKWPTQLKLEAPIYADLGYSDAEALQRKASLASHIAWTIKARHLTQEAAAQLLGMDQADIVKITRGQFRGTSEAKMLEWIAMLGHDVTILVTKTTRQRPGKIELQFHCSS